MFVRIVVVCIFIIISDCTPPKYRTSEREERDASEINEMQENSVVQALFSSTAVLFVLVAIFFFWLYISKCYEHSGKNALPALDQLERRAVNNYLDERKSDGINKVVYCSDWQATIEFTKTFLNDWDQHKELTWKNLLRIAQLTRILAERAENIEERVVSLSMEVTTDIYLLYENSAGILERCVEVLQSNTDAARDLIILKVINECCWTLKLVGTNLKIMQRIHENAARIVTSLTAIVKSEAHTFSNTYEAIFSILAQVVQCRDGVAAVLSNQAILLGDNELKEIELLKKKKGSTTEADATTVGTLLNEYEAHLKKAEKIQKKEQKKSEKEEKKLEKERKKGEKEEKKKK